MSATLSWLEVLAAIAPIAVILVLMVFFQKSAAVAGIGGLVLTVLLAAFYFGFPELAASNREVLLGLVGSSAEAGFTAATILWIIFGALCVHQLQLKTGAIDSLRHHIGALSDDPRLVAILVAWFFALFMEGAAGFGTPIALAAPFLVGFGVPPVQAVTIVLIGHSVGVSFGAVGTPVMPQLAVTDWTGLEIARTTGELHALLGAVMLAFVLALVTRRARNNDQKLVPIGRWFLLAAAGFLLPMWVISRWVGPELPTMGGALIGGAIFVIALHVARRFKRRDDDSKTTSSSDAEATDDDHMALWRAVSPYAVVITIILITRLVEPVQSSLMAIEIQWTLWELFEGQFRPLYHPGTILVLGAFCGAWLQGASRQTTAEATRAALKMLVPVTIALVAMLTISRLMVHTTMIDVLAEAAALTTGPFWPMVAPVVGVLGTFVTGSATASNILFTDFQIATADRLNFDELRLIGAQGFGAAVGNIICPHNVIAGCATVGIAGREGEVLRRTLGACLLYVALGGILVWFLI